MKIGRFIKSSLSEWKGKNSCVIEVRGCVLRSPYLVPADLFEEDGPIIDESEILEYIRNSKGNLEAISIAGGEALLQKDLYQFLKKTKTLKLPVLLKTDGTCPDSLDDLVGACMIDRTCLRIAEFSLSVPGIGDSISRSLWILSDSDTEYEVEIIAIPGITDKDLIESICRKVGGRGSVSIRRLDPGSANGPDGEKPKEFKKKEILEFVAVAKKFVKKVELKGF